MFYVLISEIQRIVLSNVHHEFLLNVSFFVSFSFEQFLWFVCVCVCVIIVCEHLEICLVLFFVLFICCFSLKVVFGGGTAIGWLVVIWCGGYTKLRIVHDTRLKRLSVR